MQKEYPAVGQGDSGPAEDLPRDAGVVSGVARAADPATRTQNRRERKDYNEYMNRYRREVRAGVPVPKKRPQLPILEERA